MLTPQIIATRRFDKQMGGYKQEEVEEFLQQVAAEYAKLQEEKEELEKKMEVLAEQVERYREDEDSLRSALIGAQKLGDSVIRDSKTKADYIMRDAKENADRMMENAQKSIEKEQIALIKMQKEVTKFKNRLLTLYRQHLEMISALPEYDDEEKEPEAVKPQQPEPKEEHHEEKPLPQEEALPAAEELDDTEPDEEETIDFTASLNEEPKEQHFAPTQAPAVQNHQHNQYSYQQPAQSMESRFGPLKFGEGFDVERDSDAKNNLFFRKKHR